MSEVDATLAGEKSPDYWEGYRKCLADKEEDQKFDEQLAREERRRLLVTLAAGIVVDNSGWSPETVAGDAAELLAAIERLEGEK